MLSFFAYSTLILALGTLFYGLVLRPQTFFRQNRFFLLLLGALSVAFPLLIGLIPESAVPLTQNVLPQQVLEPLRVGGEEKTAFWQALEAPSAWAVYALGALLFGLYKAHSTWKLRRFLVENTVPQALVPFQVPRKVNVVFSKGMCNHASFFNYLIWDNTYAYEPQECDYILRHELAHIHQGHSYDKVFFELLSIVFWFNPLVYLLRMELERVHEFLADSEAVQQKSKKSYAKLLVYAAFHKSELQFTHSFNRSLIQTRIHMLNRKNSHPLAQYKALLFVPVFAASLFVASCTKSPVAEFQETKETQKMEVEQTDVFTKVEQPAAPEGGYMAYYKTLGENLVYPESKKEGKVFLQFVVNTDGSLSDFKVLKGMEDPEYDEASIEAVKNSGAWTPAEHEGKKVRQQLVMPIVFKNQPKDSE